jgi:hypothetical protein
MMSIIMLLAYVVLCCNCSVFTNDLVSVLILCTLSFPIHAHFGHMMCLVSCLDTLNTERAAKKMLLRHGVSYALVHRFPEQEL